MVVQIRTDGYLQLSVIEYGQQLQTMSRHVPINLNVSYNFILVFNFVSRFQIVNRQGLFIFYLNTVYHGKKRKKLEKMVIVRHCNLTAERLRASRSGCSWPFSMLYCAWAQTPISRT